MSLLGNQKKVNIGDTVSGTITRILANKGIVVKLDGKGVQAFMPLHHLSVSYDLNHALLKTYTVGDQLENLLCIENGKHGPLVSLRESIAYSSQNLSVPDDLMEGQLVRCSVTVKNNNSITVSVPTKSRIYAININDHDFNTISLQTIELVDQQGIIAKVISQGQMLKLSCKFTDVFDDTIDNSLFMLKQYLLNSKRIYFHSLKSGNPLTKFKLGQKVSGIVEVFSPVEGCLLELDYGVSGVVHPTHCTQNLVQGQMVKGVVLWIDYARQYVNISLNPLVISTVDENQEAVTFDETFVCPCRSHIVHINNNFVLCTSNYKKQLVFLPNRLHESDPNLLTNRYTALSNNTIDVIIHKQAEKYLIGFERNLQTEIVKSDYKQRIEEQENSTRSVQKSEIQSEAAKNHSENAEFCDSEEDKENIAMADNSNTKKNQPCTAEKRTSVLQNEQTLNEIENKSTNATQKTITAAEYEQLLTTCPNSAKIWNNYIAFYFDSREVDKARLVAMRALEQARTEQMGEHDKLDIWGAYLYLENTCGTKEYFEEVFKKALNDNDPYKVYLKMMKIFVATKQLEALEELMGTFRNKFKHIPRIWGDMAKMYYRLRNFEKARQLRNDALENITNVKQSRNIQLQFAIIEFEYGDPKEGEMLFDAILLACPTAVNVWTHYADQLVKKGFIESARSVLEKATSQNLNFNDMQILFDKFKNFEKIYGTEETLQSVNNKLSQYITVDLDGIKWNENMLVDQQNFEPEQIKIEIGQKVSGTITRIERTGLIVNVIESNEEAFIPLHHLSVTYTLNSTLLKTYAIGEKLENLLCIENNRNGPIVSLRESIAYNKLNLSIPGDLKKNQLVRGSIIANDDRSIRVNVPTKSGNYDIHVPIHDKSVNLYHSRIVSQEGILLKITSVGDIIKASCSIKDVFDGSIDDSMYLLEQYLLNIQRIHLYLVNRGNPIAKFYLGQKVKGTVTRFLAEGGCRLLLQNGVQANVLYHHCPDKIMVGEKVEGVVLWTDYVNNLLLITLRPDHIANIDENQVSDDIIDEPFACTSVILILNKDFALCLSNYKKKLVFVPSKLYENDFGSLYERNQNFFNSSFELLLHKNAGGHFVGFEYTLQLWIVKNYVKTDMKLKSKNKNEATANNSEENDSKKRKNNEKPNHCTIKNKESSDTDVTHSKKKIKLTGDVEMTKVKDEKDDLCGTSKTAEEFEKLLLANPTSTKIWIEYITFYLNKKEIEKARAVIMVALQANKGSYHDRLLIWAAYLNLEYTHGTKASFHRVFNEATQYSGAFDVYLETIRMFANTNQLEAMEDMIKAFTITFHNIPDTWTELAEMYYELGKLDDARKMRTIAFNSIIAEEEIIELTIQFALLEFRYGAQAEGEMLFETVLFSHPEMEDVWNVYVKELQNKGCTESANRVLRRSISH